MNSESTQAENWQLIKAPLGEPWSGRARYAAAVWFYKAGMMEAHVLEIYRILSRLDNEDPVGLLLQSPEGRAWAEKLNRSAEPDYRNR